MRFAAPSAFWLAILLPAVVILYMLKLRRQDVLVASTYLWRRSLEDMHANAPFQRLVRNFLMIAQLVALGVMVFGAARPILAGRLLSGRSIAILIDASASMQASDVAHSRLEAAKSAALGLVGSLSDRDQAMVVAFHAKPAILASLTSDKPRLSTAVSSVQPTDAGGSLREALLIASSVLRGRNEASILILSDGRVRGLDTPVPSGISVLYKAMGTRGRNAGITAVDARPVEEDPERSQVFVETRAAGIGGGKVSLYLDGGLVDARKLVWREGRPASMVFEVRGRPGARVRVALEAAQDDLPADDAAHLVLPERPHRKILLVTGGNYFLERLLNLERNADLFTISPKDYEAKLSAEGPGDYDLTVLDRWAPARLAEGRYLMFGAVPPIEGFKAVGVTTGPLILDWKRGNPLLRGANLANLRVKKAIRWELPPWAEPLLESSESPLIVQARRGNLWVAAVGFDLFDSDWPFRLSFPIFVSNAIRTLGGEGLGESRLLRPGDAIQWRTQARPPPSALKVSGPSGAAHPVPFGGGDRVTFADTLRAGFYELDDGYAKRTYGVSVRSPDETDTAPVAEKDFVLTGETTARTAASLEQKPLWAWFAGAALALLCLEWAMYHRRWL